MALPKLRAMVRGRPVFNNRNNVQRIPTMPRPAAKAPAPKIVAPPTVPKVVTPPAAPGGFTIPKNLPAWAQDQLRAMDTQALSNQAYAQNVNQQLGAQLAPVQNTMAAGENQYRQALANATALAGQAAQFNPQIQGMTGGMAQDPLGYLRQANATANQAMAGYNEASQGARSIDRVTGVGNLAQGLLAGAAYNAQQLPMIYTKNRNEYIAKIDQWKAEQDAQTYSDTLKFAASQGANLTKQQIAQLSQEGQNARTGATIAGANARTQAQIDAANARAAAKLAQDATKSKVAAAGGYRGLNANQYARARNSVGGEISKLGTKVDASGNLVHSTEFLYDYAVGKGLRPSDALQQILRLYPTVDNGDRNELLRLLRKHLPGKNANAVLAKLLRGIQVLNVDKPGREDSGLGT